MKDRSVKVNVPIASALSATVVDKIEKINKAAKDAKTKEFRKSGEYKRLLKLYRYKQSVVRQYSKIELAFEKKHGVNVYHTNAHISIEAPRKSIPSLKTIRTDLIIANAVEGVPINKVVDHVVKKYTKKK